MKWLAEDPLASRLSPFVLVTPSPGAPKRDLLGILGRSGLTQVLARVPTLAEALSHSVPSSLP